MPSHEQLQPGDPRNLERQRRRIDFCLDAAESIAHEFIAERLRILYDVGAATTYANDLQEMVARELSIDLNHARVVDAVRIQQLVEIISSGQDMILFMRHGTQSIEDHEHITDDAIRKIRMMQQPHNVLNPITEVSLVEGIGMGAVLDYLTQYVSGRRVEIHSTRNLRGAQVASMLSCATESHIHYDQRLTCPDYLPLHAEQINTMLGPEKRGTLPWQRDIVDRVCGEGTFERITEDMMTFKTGLEHRRRRTLPLSVTHTQQMNALGVQGRLDTFGLCILQGSNDPIVWPSGIFKPRNPDV